MGVHAEECLKYDKQLSINVQSKLLSWRITVLSCSVDWRISITLLLNHLA